MIELPALKTMEDALAAQSTIVEAVSTGEMTPAEGKALTELVEGFRKSFEARELEQRLTALEAQQ